MLANNQWLMAMGAPGKITANVYALTGSTNNYTASVSANYTSYGFTSTFNGQAPGTVTGQSTDANYACNYSATHTQPGVSFNWTVTAALDNYGNPTAIRVSTSNVLGATLSSWDGAISSYYSGTLYQAFPAGNFNTNVGTALRHSDGGGIDVTDYSFSINTIYTSIGTITSGSTFPFINSFGDGLGVGTNNSGSFSYSTDNYALSKQKLFYSFDTSFLGSTATIESATLYVNTSSISNNNSAQVSLWVPAGWPPTTGNATIYTGTSTSLATSKALNTLTSGGYTAFTVTPASISKTGTTRCRMEVANPNQPSLTTTTNAFNVALNGTTRPYLSITYTP